MAKRGKRERVMFSRPLASSNPHLHLDRMFAAFLAWLQSLFWSKKLEVALVGLQASGKASLRSPDQPVCLAALTSSFVIPQTSLVNVLAAGEFSESMVPTVCVGRSF